MNPEVKESTRIIKVINQHLDEEPECKHNIRFIMSHALESKSGTGPGTTEPNTNRTDDNTDTNSSFRKHRGDDIP